MKKFLTFTLFCSVLSACAISDLADTTSDMNQTTKNMEQQTQDLNNTTDELLELSEKIIKMTEEIRELMDELSELTSQLSADSRAALLAQLRDQFWATLLLSEAQGEMIPAAVGYVKTFLFQAITPLERKDSGFVGDVYEETIFEFFLKLSDYADKDLDIKGTLSDQSDASMIVRALAASADQVNIYQKVRHREDPTYEMISLLDLIERGLFAKKDLMDGVVEFGDIPVWKRTVLQFENHAVYFLNVRMNFYQALTFQLFAGADAESNFTWTWFGFGWVPKVKEMNDFELLLVHNLLEEAVRIQNFLRTEGAGWSVQKDSEIKRVFKRMDKDELENSGSQSSLRRGLLEGIIEFIQILSGD